MTPLRQQKEGDVNYSLTSGSGDDDENSTVSSTGRRRPLQIKNERDSSPLLNKGGPKSQAQDVEQQEQNESPAQHRAALLDRARKEERQRQMKHRHRGWTVVGGLVCLVIVIVGVAAGISVYMMTRKSANNPTMNMPTSNETTFDNTGLNPSPYYSQDETPKEESERRKHRSDIANLLALNDISKSNDLVRPGTPQNAALEWLSTQDPMAISPHLHWKHFVQRYVLVVLYFSLNVDAIPTSTPLQFDLPTTDTGLDSWLSSKHECDWDYISCELISDNNVTTDSNNIGGRELQEELMVVSTISLLDLSQVSKTLGVGMHMPYEIGFLLYLKSIQVSHLGWTGLLPESLNMLASLKTVEITQNTNITGPLPDLANATNLEVLNLEGNNLNGTIPESLQTLTALRQLKLSSNALTGTVPNTFADLDELIELTLGDNQFEGDVSIAICGLPASVNVDIKLSNDMDSLLCSCCSISPTSEEKGIPP